MTSSRNKLIAINELESPDCEAPGLTVSPLETRRLHKAKAAYTTRRVPISAASHLISGSVTPSPGDLVLAQVDRLSYQEAGYNVQQHLKDRLGSNSGQHILTITPKTSRAQYGLTSNDIATRPPFSTMYQGAAQSILRGSLFQIRKLITGC